MKTIQTCLLTTTLLFAAIDTAQAAMMAYMMNDSSQAAQTPNFYECTGNNVHATLSVGTSKAEVSILPTQTTLSLDLGKKSYTFKEEEISRESTLIGELWEVAVKSVPDLYSSHATLVVPTITLDNAPVAFKSQLILTRVATSITGEPGPGVVNSSRYIPVKCSASMVYY